MLSNSYIFHDTGARLSAKSEDRKGFTTGQVAEICHVTIPTVIKWIDSGRLKGFKLPGSKSRRVSRDDLIEFMRENSIPLERLDRAKRRILIVDDDPRILDLLKAIFEEEGDWEIRLVSRGFDAGLAKEFRPDCILLDIMLPDIDGRKVCSYLRQSPELATVKIIAISGYISQGGFQDLLAQGFDDFLVKPFSNEELVGKVRKLVERE
ncbi:MAG: response regulator [Planctomycetes bacterium]|nr:response regulator [Planctomycetota bacterium]